MVFERFTDRARRVIVLAQEEARILNHNYIGTEHILLGLIHESEGIAVEALASLGVSLATARTEVEKVIGRGKEPPSGHIPFTPRAKKVLELSAREASRLGHPALGSEHLLLGLIREGEGVGAQVLMQLGVELEAARRAVLQRLSERGPETAAPSFAEGVYAYESPPRCTMCKAPLTEKLKYQVVGVPATVGEGVRQLLVVYCSSCGDTINAEILAEGE